MKEDNCGPLVSIIIPAHNASRTLKRCISSILEQTYYNIEIIIVINSSSDSTYDIAKEFQMKDNRIFIIETHQGGVSNARNLGLENANGSIIGFCDADDYYDRKIIQYIVPYIDKDNYDIAICGYTMVTEDGSTYCRNILKTKMYFNSESYIKNVVLNDYIMGSVWNKFFKKSLFHCKGDNFNDGTVKFNSSLILCEDTCFNVAIGKANQELRAIYINVSGYNYVDNQTSVTHMIETQFRDEINYYILAMDFLENNFTLTRDEIRVIKSKKVILSQRIYSLLNSNLDITNLKNKKSRIKRTILINFLDFLKCKNINYKTKSKGIINLLLQNIGLTGIHI